MASDFSKFDLSVGYIPGKDNLIPDILSRWAYPASEAYRNISIHGCAEDDEEMKEFQRRKTTLEQARQAGTLGTLKNKKK